MNIFSNKNFSLMVLSSGLLILIIALFFPNVFDRKSTPVGNPNKEIVQIKTQSSDTSLDSIKKDLDETDLNNLDEELESIESELNASI